MTNVQNIELIPGKVITLSTCLDKPSPFLFGFEIQDKFLEELEKYSFDKIFFLQSHTYLNYIAKTCLIKSVQDTPVRLNLCLLLKNVNLFLFWKKPAKF